MLKRQGEELCIEYQEWILFQKINRQWLGIAFSKQTIAFYFINSEKTHPLLTLVIILTNLLIELIWHTIERNAIVALHHELLLQPKTLLEVLQLRQEVDDFLTNLLNGFYYSQLALQLGSIKVGNDKHFVLEIEVQLATEESPQVFMNKVVERVLGRIGIDMLLQQY